MEGFLKVKEPRSHEFYNNDILWLREVKGRYLVGTTGYDSLADTGLAETTGLADKLSQKETLENWLVLFTGFEDMTVLEDKKGLTGFFFR